MEAELLQYSNNFKNSNKLSKLILLTVGEV